MYTIAMLWSLCIQLQCCGHYVYNCNVAVIMYTIAMLWSYILVPDEGVPHVERLDKLIVELVAAQVALQ